MTLTRRQFLKSSAALAGWSLLPSAVRADAPNSRFCTAHIGIGGMGRGDLKNITSHPQVQVVGVADVDRAVFTNERIQPMIGEAAQFADYREMLDSLGDKIDGVVISTPDHTHFPAARLAMELGKPVYLQKPLTHEIAEAYELQRLARDKNLVTQMGIQCHSADAYRIAVDFLQQGIIGKVSKVYAWSQKAWGHEGPPYEGSDPVPETLDWNLWLGTAPERPYLNRKYHPGNWRRIIDFGCGTLGDMGVHILDTPCTALKLGYPRSVRVTCSEPNHFSYPTTETIEFEFPGTEYTTDTLPLVWYDGGNSPHAAPSDNPDLQLEETKPSPDNPEIQVTEPKNLPPQGAMFIGEDGKRLLLPHLGAPQPLPRSLLQTITKPKLEPVNHYHQWVNACLGQGTCSANFEYSAPLTVINLLGVVGNRFPGKTLEWDGAQMRFPNHAEANKLLTRTYRTDY